MNAFILCLIYFGFGFPGGDSKQYHPKTDRIDYRAVRYSIPVNYSLAQEMMGYGETNPNSFPKIVTAYQYYIQYGSDLVIDILDPGIGMEFMGIIIKKWDIVNGKTQFIHYMDYARKYSILTDTVNVSIEESRGHVTNLCIDLAAQSICDSVKIVSYSGDAEYTVCFNDTMPNMPFRSLFYPDIKYLPTSISGIGYSNTTMSLEELIYGKQAVDSLLQLFTFENYSLITDEDRNQISEQEVLELMEEFDRATKKKN